MGFPIVPLQLPNATLGLKIKCPLSESKAVLSFVLKAPGPSNTLSECNSVVEKSRTRNRVRMGKMPRMFLSIRNKCPSAFFQTGKKIDDHLEMVTETRWVLIGSRMK